MLSCLSNISFNITCSVTRLCATQRKVNSLRSACVLNNTFHDMIRPQWNSVQSVSACLPQTKTEVVRPISFCLLAKVASANRKPTCQNWISTRLWLVGYRQCRALNCSEACFQARKGKLHASIPYGFLMKFIYCTEKERSSHFSHLLKIHHWNSNLVVYYNLHFMLLVTSWSSKGMSNHFEIAGK